MNWKDMQENPKFFEFMCNKLSEHNKTLLWLINHPQRDTVEAKIRSLFIEHLENKDTQHV